MKKSGEIIIYKSKFGAPDISLRLEQGSLWLDHYQIAELFQTNRTSIVKHIRNIYDGEELEEKATCAFFAQVQMEGKRKIKRNIKVYNLDLIISVGYRVNSGQGTQFRIWANNILKDHLINGYTKNVNRLKDLKKTIEIVSRVAKSENAIINEASDLLEVLANYTAALNILDDYDHQRLKIHTSENDAYFRINYTEAKNAIELLKIKFGESELFGREKDQSFKSSIAVIDQTFDGKELYPSIEEKAAHLLYFVTKNHSFTDGNKRIAAWLFVWYLEKNHFLYAENGKLTIAESTLVALTLMIAESRPEEKDVIIKVIVNLIQLKEG